MFSESQEGQRTAIRDMVIPNNGLQGVLCDLCASAREKHDKKQTSIRQSSRRDAENAEGFGSQILILLAAHFKCVRTGAAIRGIVIPNRGTHNKESPASGIRKRGFIFKKRRLPTLPHCIAVPSAMAGLTALFGMGRGGAPPQ